MTLTFYKNLFATPCKCELDKLVQSIRTSSALCKRTEQYRLLRQGGNPDDQKMADDLKKGAPALLPAVHTHGKRTVKDITEVTGLVLCDFDHVPAERFDECRRLVQADPHTLLSYRTISGEGLRVIARFEKPEGDSLAHLLELFNQYFVKVNRYYSALIGCPYDAQCSDPVRLSFAAYDPEAYYQPAAVTFTDTTAFPATTVAPATEQPEATAPAGKLSNKKYNSAKLRIGRLYDNFISPILEEQGVTFAPGQHNNYVMRVGYLLNQCGIELPLALRWAEEKFAAEYPETAGVIKSCYGKEEEFGIMSEDVKDVMDNKVTSKKNGSKHASLGQVQAFINEHTKVKCNDLSEITEIKFNDPSDVGLDDKYGRFHAVNEEIVNTLRLIMEARMEAEVQTKDILCSLRSLFVRHFHPALDYLESLPEWHEGDKDYIAELAATVKVTEDYPHAQELFAHVLKKFLVGMVSAWTDTKKVNEIMLIFVGKQGTYKTTWMRSLLPPELQDYCVTKQFIEKNEKDDTLEHSQNLLILHDEFSVLSEERNNALKSRITAESSKVRITYAVRPAKRYNTASVCGTSNYMHILPDYTGSRRMAVFAVSILVSPWDHPHNHEGIFSQAYSLAKSGYTSHLTKEEEAELELHNMQFSTIDELEGYVSMLFRRPTSEQDARFMTTSEIMGHIRLNTHCAKISDNKLECCLRKFGYKECKLGDGNTTGFIIQLNSYTEFERTQKALAVEVMKEEMGSTEGV